MRFSSAFVVLAMWNLAYMMGTIYMQIVPAIFACFVFNELRGLKRDDEKDKQSDIKVVEWMLFGLSSFVFLPKGSFRREILENSGFSAETNPVVFGLLFDYHNMIIVAFGIIIFLAFIMGLKKETVRYQMAQFFFACLSAFYASSTAFTLQYVSYYGRYWFFYPMFCVSWNDASAYFLGRAFGRTKLISLSPKKTVEGFVGALLSNVITTFLYLDYWLKDNNFWTCAPMKLTYHPFEDYQCQEVHYIY